MKVSEQIVNQIILFQANLKLYDRKGKKLQSDGYCNYKHSKYKKYLNQLFHQAFALVNFNKNVRKCIYIYIYYMKNI